MYFSTILTSVIFSVVLILSNYNGVSAQLGEIITSPPTTNWGDWGLFEHCPNGTFVQGFQLKTEPYRGPLIDDTASDAVRLFCGDPFNNNTKTIMSSQGSWGNWGAVYTCGTEGYLYGFQLRVDKNTVLDDEMATNNFRFFCNNADPATYLEGDGLVFGNWTATQKCARTQALCGIQTQVQKDQGLLLDDTALNNIAAECCDLPVSTTAPPTAPTTTPTTTTSTTTPTTTTSTTTPTTTTSTTTPTTTTSTTTPTTTTSTTTPTTTISTTTPTTTTSTTTPTTTTSTTTPTTTTSTTTPTTTTSTTTPTPTTSTTTPTPTNATTTVAPTNATTTVTPTNATTISQNSTTTTPSPTTPYDGPFRCSDNGNFVDPCNCGVFHSCECSFGTCRDTVLECAPALIFCEDKQLCDFAGTCPCNTTGCK